MPDLALNLETLSNMSMDCSFPSDMTAREVADDIANQLHYPVLDPETNEQYVLIRQQLYDRLVSLMADATIYASGEQVDKILAEFVKKRLLW